MPSAALSRHGLLRFLPSASFEIAGGAFDYGLFYGHSTDHSDDIVYSCAE